MPVFSDITSPAELSAPEASSNAFAPDLEISSFNFLPLAFALDIFVFAVSFNEERILLTFLPLNLADTSSA